MISAHAWYHRRMTWFTANIRHGDDSYSNEVCRISPLETPNSIILKFNLLTLYASTIFSLPERDFHPPFCPASAGAMKSSLLPSFSLCVSRLEASGYLFFFILLQPSLSIRPLSRDVEGWRQVWAPWAPSVEIFNSLPHKEVSNILFISSLFLFSLFFFIFIFFVVVVKKMRWKNGGGKIKRIEVYRSWTWNLSFSFLYCIPPL
jgi:hypothetical protein